MSGLYALAGPVLRALDAETAHNLTIAALAAGLNPFRAGPSDPQLRCDVLGLQFPNPVGLAAGFDKNAEVPDAMLDMGFGFAEVGTVTPLAQQGNPRPRLFRLREDRAVINRMGFNNQGHQAVLARLERRRGRPGIVGVNIGANKESPDRIDDYVKGVQTFCDLADYLTVNISSPNTPGLRGLQSRSEFENLTKRLMEARDGLGSATPIVVKIAPDLGEDEMADIAAVALSCGIDGLIVSNTTLSRSGLSSPNCTEQGGLSGAPLFERSTVVLARMYRLTKGTLPIIGAGGIDDGESAWQKILAGASLVQIYSALIYQGPKLVRDIQAHLLVRMRENGLSSLSEATGQEAERWATREIGA